MNEYIGIPFLVGGRTQKGLDCYGLVRHWYAKELNVILPELNVYDEIDPKVIQELINVNTPLVELKEMECPKFGDIGVFMIQGFWMHMGIYIGDGKILHIWRETFSVVERLDSIRLRNRRTRWLRMI